MGLKLFIDIPLLLESGTAVDEIKCSYLYHRSNQGSLSIIEIAEFGVYCRECKDAFCISVCPKEALQQQDNGLIRRYNMLCVGCKSCALACPFGTIFPEVMNYISSKCDYCLNQLGKNTFIPACVKTAPPGSILIKDMDMELPEEHIHFVGEHLAVKSHSWLKREGRK